MKTKMEIIFQEDEMRLLAINPNWSREDILAKTGIVFLKDIAHALDINSLDIKQRAQKIKDCGRCPYKVMGVRKVWNHWLIRLEIFGPYYQTKLKPLYTGVDPQWDANVLLEEKGTYLLSDVCKLLPFAPHQLRYKVRQNPRAKLEYGIWKEQRLYLVNMIVFAPWIKSQWSRLETKSRTRQAKTRTDAAQI